MKQQTVESLLKEAIDGLSIKDIWWELAETHDDNVYCKTWQTFHYQMLNQLKRLQEENKVIMTNEGIFLWIVNEKMDMTKYVPL